MEKGTVLKDNAYINLCFDILTTDTNEFGFAECTWIMISVHDGFLATYEWGMVDTNRPTLTVTSNKEMMDEIDGLRKKLKKEIEKRMRIYKNEPQNH